MENREYKEFTEEEMEKMAETQTEEPSKQESLSNEYREFELEDPEAPVIPSDPRTHAEWGKLDPQTKEYRLFEYEKQKRAREEWERSKEKKAA